MFSGNDSMTNVNREPETEHPCFAPQFEMNVLKRGYSFSKEGPGLGSRGFLV